MKFFTSVHGIIILALLFSGCVQSAPVNRPEKPVSQELTIFAAASLTESFTDLAQEFENEFPGVQVTLNFAGSQQLAQQLAHGAPADVFVSANHTQMRVAVETGRIQEEDIQILTNNQLIVILPGDNPASITTLADLARPNLKIVLAAEQVPVGRYSLAFFDQAAQDPALGEAFRRGVYDNVVSFEQTVKAVLSKVLLGEADAGIVYTSDVTTVEGQVQVVEIPMELNQIAEYPVAPVSDSAQPDLASRFITFALSPAGQDILAQYGFLSPP